MIAFGPAENPEIAIGIVLEYGGAGARTGNLVADIFNAYFAYKNGTLTLDDEVLDDGTGTAESGTTDGSAADATTDGTADNAADTAENAAADADTTAGDAAPTEQAAAQTPETQTTPEQ